KACIWQPTIPLLCRSYLSLKPYKPCPAKCVTENDQPAGLTWAQQQKGVGKMNASSLKHARASDITDKVRDISAAVSDRWRDTYRDAELNARKLRIAAEGGVHHTRKRIKSRPIAAVAVAASGGFLLSSLVGRLTGRRRRWF